MGTQPLLSRILVMLLVVAGCSGSSPTAAPGPAATPTGSAPPIARTISGQVKYAGSQLGSHKIVVVASRSGEQGPPAYSATIAKPGPYSLSGVADGTYLISAFIDLGDDMGAPQSNEPQGWYDVAGDGTPDPIEIKNGNAATAVDMTLVDR